MGKVVLSQQTLDLLVEMVKASITVAVGLTIKDDKSTGKLKDPDKGITEFAENGILEGNGYSEFLYSNGMILRVVWSFRIDGIKSHVVIESEEAVRPH